MEYKIISDAHIPNIEEKINEHLLSGWKCQGGICIIAAFHNEAFMMQAMTKE